MERITRGWGGKIALIVGAAMMCVSPLWLAGCHKKSSSAAPKGMTVKEGKKR